ncbi:bacitracin ABC transporter ATP-binding protein [Lysinibacillus sp. FJAT-14745]|uniref:ABC transporter ATP-binding protein n=1 Tax=Lysinibacillus sp. FJAT-14745 TaxID=1704289 RepID=UPI0006AB808A|nr:ABC transporter ATP-binding protein [Lysinibacillus sp. FJAT-14745]KOP72401.1 bacitracin ABC transporter ATP-binding protein [Lysinibacillus sp. FJAT-14745]
MDYILKTYNLTKKYKDITAVENVNMTIKKGDIYGFIGKNGAGKTTLIRMITGLINPTSGNVEIFGHPVSRGNKAFLERIGTIIEFPGSYQNLTARENLEMHRRLMRVSDKKRIDEVLELVNLQHVSNKKVKGFSLGMKQRLGIARALLHKPEFLILDEPTNGLDPVGIKEIRQLIIDLAKTHGITILVSSHILSEIHQMVTRIGIINNGHLLEEVGYEAIKERNRHFIEAKVSNDKKAAYLLENHFAIENYSIIEPGIIRIYESLENSPAINKIFVKNGIDVAEIKISKDTLEDYFLKLTGGENNA